MFESDTIKRMEDDLQIALPTAYSELLLAYPFANEPDPDDWEMFGSINIIIEQNRYYRERGFFGTAWPSSFLIIGDDGFGDLYFLDLSRHDEVVFFADHETTSEADGIDMYEEASSLEEWIAQIRAERARAQAEEDRSIGKT